MGFELSLRKLYKNESFEVEGCIIHFTTSKSKFDFATTARYGYELPTRVEDAWVVYERGKPFKAVGVVAGKPGYWRLYYYHEKKQLQVEKIAIPRLALIRMRQLIIENRY